MSLNDKLLKTAAAAGGLVPSEHFGVVIYEGDSKSGHSINGGKFGAAAAFGIEKSTTQSTDSRINTTYYAKNVGSISGWFKKNGNTNELEYLFVTKDDTGSAHQLGINLMQEADSDLSARVGNGSSTTNVDTSGLTLNNDAWHHFVVTWNLPNSTNNVKVYINGSLSSTGSQTTGTWTGNSSRTFQLGHYTNTNTNNGFAGMIDQVRVFEKELSSSEVSTLYAETASTVESLDPLSEDTTNTLQVLGDTSCIATYRFENDEVDLSGNYNGTGTAIQYAAGRYGQSASFNGSSSFINPNGDWGVNGDSSHSVSFWVNFNSTADQHFYGIGDTVTAYTHTSLIIDSSLGRVYHDNNGNADILATSLGLSTGQWYHFVLTYNSSDDGLELYIDNVSKGTATRTLNVVGDAVIGRRPYYASNYLNADLDQFRVFNKELSASEVTTLYQENSLVASYRLDGNSNDDMRTYNGTDNDITYEFGLNFTPDFVWIKKRDATENHRLYDSTRGVSSSTNTLYPSLNFAASTESPNGLESFDTGGFTVANQNSVNSDGNDFVAWCLKAGGTATNITSSSTGVSAASQSANPAAGFSIVSYTLNASNPIIPHGLNSTPKVALVKRTDSAADWFFYNTVVSGSGRGILNTVAAFTNSGVPTFDSTNLTFQTNDPFNSGSSAVIYFFTEVAGYSKISTYTGNGSTNGPSVNTGFEPAFLMIKNASISTAGSYWAIYDNKRTPSNPRDTILQANSNSADFDADSLDINFLSNGFQVTGTYDAVNGNGYTYLYMAFAADPDTEQPTVARSFNVQAYDGTATSQTIDNGFKTGLLFAKCRNVAHHWGIHDIVRGPGKWLISNTTNADQSGSYGIEEFGENSTTLYGNFSPTNSNYLSGKYVSYFWKADDNEPTINTEGSINSLVSANANAGFSIVKYTGTFSAATVGHGLSSAPELVIVKNTDSTTNWWVWHTSLGDGTKYLKLNGSDAVASVSSIWNSTVPTSTVFSVANDGGSNGSGNEIIAYCWHSVAGYSKFGSYSTNASTKVSTGFRPDFILMKYINSANDWFICDSVRSDGTTGSNGGDLVKPVLYGNKSDAEASVSTGSVEIVSDGFYPTNFFNSNGVLYMAFRIN